MIPKKIHYCWFGDKPHNEKFDDCVESWKKYHPNYELKLWSEENFNLDETPQYVKDAYAAGVYSMVSDYVRAKALYEEGGWYVDTDVEFLQPFLDRYAEYNFVSPVEYSVDEGNEYGMKIFFHERLDKDKRNKKDDGFVSGIAICVSLIGAQKGCKFLKDVLDFYEKLDFNKRDYPGCLFGGPIGPQIYAKNLEPYGFRYEAVEQHLDDNMLITGTEVMRNGEDEKTHDGITCAVHRCSFSWFGPYLNAD